MSGLRFLKNFLKAPGTVGAIWPSSPHLAREMVKDVGLERAGAVVELGPGTGVFTPFILGSLGTGANFFAVELNKELHDCFKSRLPGVKVYHEDAANLRALLAAENLERVDTIVSGLPWAAFPPGLQDRLLDVVLSVLPEGGHFTTFAYLQGLALPTGLRFRAALRRKFSEVRRSKVEWRNLPPAFCYRCRK